MEGLNLFRIDKMITVTDDWCPCFEGNKVKLSIFIQNNSKLNYHFVRICVWGADDLGMELDYHSTNFDNLKYHYNIWKEHIFDKVPENVNRLWFFEHGFYPA